MAHVAAGSSNEEIIEPDLPIVDPHHHLWDKAGDPYLFGDLMRDVSSGHNIVASVFIECGAMLPRDGPEVLKPVGEVEFVAGAAAMSDSGLYGSGRICAGIVGHVDLRQADWVETVIAAEMMASGMRLKGVRHAVCWDADTSFGSPRTRAPKGTLADPAFRAGFAKLAGLGMTFDAWLYHPQLAELTDLAGAYPDTTIVLNHVGAPLGLGVYAGRRQEVLDEWRQSLRGLAACPNVFVKLGGLGMPLCGFGFDLRPVPASSEELAAAWRPYIETCIELFGTQRCMFESNFPVERPSCTYAVVWNVFKRLTAAYSTDERTALFSGTASRIYRLALP